MRLFRKRGDARPVEKLHVGAGSVVLPGWWNVDLKPGPGVDQAMDVRDGLPFEGLRYVYAEHFIEHLTFDEGLAFLRECRRALSSEGTLRLSTPNLDWVVITHYHVGSWSSGAEAVRDALMLNRAFHGWGHRFLYNRPMLEASLLEAGFGEVTFHRYGESAHSALAGIERHETYPDDSELPHLVIAEARNAGSGKPLPQKDLAYYRAALGAR
jgi:predicted SAM-dependent methyltransferase